MNTTIERNGINSFDDRQLMAYWNILQYRSRPGTVLIDADGRTARHLQIVHELLNERRIVHEIGRLLDY
jgi:hypothetical protein